jgi:proteasome lid subunit RPN8/RPN11
MAEGKVKLNLEIYKTMIASATRYANPRIKEEDWAEIYGLLYGYNDGDDVVITEAIPFTHTKKKGHILKVEFEEEDYALAADIESQMFDRTPPQFIVGWFHSHPGILLMLSQDDVKTQLSWQTNNPKAIAIVFNPTRLGKQVEVAKKKGDPVKPLHNDTGFLCFRLDDTTKGIEGNFHEVKFEFTDLEHDENLIKNAQEFMGWVTKSFPRDDAFLAESKKFIQSTISKLQEIYTGTESYLKTLMRKNDTDRFAAVLEDQERDANKILDTGNTMVSVFRMMMPYLEYKERERMVPQLEATFKLWDDKAASFLNDLRSLPQAVKNKPSK